MVAVGTPWKLVTTLVLGGTTTSVVTVSVGTPLESVTVITSGEKTGGGVLMTVTVGVPSSSLKISTDSVTNDGDTAVTTLKIVVGDGTNVTTWSTVRVSVKERTRPLSVVTPITVVVAGTPMMVVSFVTVDTTSSRVVEGRTMPMKPAGLASGAASVMVWVPSWPNLPLSPMAGWVPVSAKLLDGCVRGGSVAVDSDLNGLGLPSVAAAVVGDDPTATVPICAKSPGTTCEVEYGKSVDIVIGTTVFAGELAGALSLSSSNVAFCNSRLDNCNLGFSNGGLSMPVGVLLTLLVGLGLGSGMILLSCSVGRNWHAHSSNTIQTSSKTISITRNDLLNGVGL